MSALSVGVQRGPWDRDINPTVHVVFGLVILALSLLCWGGQTIALFAPVTAARFGLTEKENEVEPAFWADVRGEALWDFLTLWTMVVAAALSIADHHTWPYFGLVGGATYVYFAGRGVSTRLALRRRGLRIGNDRGVRAAIVFLVIWGLMGFATLIAAARELIER